MKLLKNVSSKVNHWTMKLYFMLNANLAILFGIGSTNLVNPKAPTNPELKNLKTLDIMERPKVFVVEPRSLNSDQRPMIFN